MDLTLPSGQRSEIQNGASDDLADSRAGGVKVSLLPVGWKYDVLSNLLAGARYYGSMMSRYHVPRSEAAAAYNGGIRMVGARGNRHRRYKGISDAWGYQASFDTHRASNQQLVDCMSGKTE